MPDLYSTLEKQERKPGKQLSGDLYQQLNPETYTSNDTYDPSEGMSRAEAGLVGLGSGFVRFGRGVKGLFGLLTGDEDIQRQVSQEAQEQRQRMSPLKERYPYATGAGEIAGEALGTLPAGMGAGSLAAKGGMALGSQALARYGAAGIGGLTEGAIIGAAEDQAGMGAGIGGATAVALEYALPKIGRLAGKYLRRSIGVDDLKTPEAINRLAEELRAKGASPDEIARALDDISNMGPIPQGANAEQLARKAAFEAEGIPIAGRSRITQNTEDFAREIQLSRQVDSDQANEMRRMLFQEDQAIEDRARQLAMDMGESEEAAITIQSALRDLKTDIGTRKRAAYRELDDLVKQNPEVSEMVPIPKTSISQKIQEAQSGPLRASAAEQEALDSIMAQYGMIGDKVTVGPRFTKVDFLNDSGDVVDSIKFRGKPRELNIGTAESFRQQLNNIFDPRDPRQAAAASMVMPEFDRMLEEVAEEIPDAVPEAIRQAAKKARGIAREEKVIFNPKRIVDKLSRSNADGAILMDASKVYENIRRSTNEDFNRLISGLKKTESGEGALNNLKAAALVDFVEQATKTAKKLSFDGASRREFSGTNFRKAIDKFGREKARKLFGDQWANIQRLEKIGESRIAPDAAVQKGSAPDLINKMINTFTRLSSPVPVVREGIEAITSPISRVAERSAQKSALRKTQDLSPTVEQVNDYIVYSAPRLASLLGITNLVTAQSTEKE